MCWKIQYKNNVAFSILSKFPSDFLISMGLVKKLVFTMSMNVQIILHEHYKIVIKNMHWLVFSSFKPLFLD